MTFLRDLHFQWQECMEFSDEKDMKTTRDQRPSSNQLQLNMGTAFGKTQYGDVVCPVTTALGKSWQGEVPDCEKPGLYFQAEFVEMDLP